MSEFTNKALKKLTFGYVTNVMSETICMTATQGIWAEAERLGINIVTLPCESLARPSSIEGNMHRVMLDIVDPSTLDGVICFHWWRDKEWFERVMHRFLGRPIINIARNYPGYHSVIFDPTNYLKTIVRHCVEVHQHKRIIFLLDSTVSPVITGRIEGYKKALESFGIPFRPEFVVAQVPGSLPTKYGKDENDFDHVRCDHIKEILEERRLKPGADFDAVIAFNDRIAGQTVNFLREYGYNVPYDVAVYGFDNIDVARLSNPPLTTIDIPWFQIGQTAVQSLVSVIQGEAVPQPRIIDEELIIRRSCGCQTEAILGVEYQPPVPVSAGFWSKIGTKLPFVLRKSLPQVEAEVRQLRNSLLAEWASRSGWNQELDLIFDRFCLEVFQGTRGVFLEEIDLLIRKMSDLQFPVDKLQTILNHFRKTLLPVLDLSTCHRVENLFHQAQMIISDAFNRRQNQAYLEEQGMTERWRLIELRMSASFDLDEILSVIDAEFIELGLSEFYISLFVDPSHPEGQLELIYGRNQAGRVELAAQDRVFASAHLVPPRLAARNRSLNRVAKPLYFEKDQIGMLVVDDGPRTGSIYGILQLKLSSALKGVLVLRELNQSKKVLETTLNTLQKKTEIISSNTNRMNERVQEVSSATKAVAISIGEISRSINHVLEIVAQAVQSANRANVTIHDLSATSKEISSITEMITDIADKTNILALNATILAATAGKTGKGFMVVAHEVKNLTVATTDSAKNIASNIELIQTHSNLAVDTINEVVQTIKKISEQSAAITGEITEQSGTTNRISDMISDLANSSQEIAEAIDEVSTLLQSTQIS